jgi:CRP-like cAMP-binding protein
VSRLGRSFIGGLLLWGLPLTVLALTPGPAVAGLALAAVGIGNAVEDVGVFTLVARAVNARVVGRVLCAKEFVAQAGLSAGSLACGDCFGEIALLRDIPRTATIMAEQPMRTLAIGRQPFLVAVAGNSLSCAAADALVTRRLAADRPAVAGGGAVLGVPWLNR